MPKKGIFIHFRPFPAGATFLPTMNGQDHKNYALSAGSLDCLTSSLQVPLITILSSCSIDKWIYSIITSPIVLVPVSLTLEFITSPFVLRLHEDEIVINPTLKYKMEHDFGVTLPEFDADEDSITEYLNKCQKGNAGLHKYRSFPIAIIRYFHVIE